MEGNARKREGEGEKARRGETKRERGKDGGRKGGRYAREEERERERVRYNVCVCERDTMR